MRYGVCVGKHSDTAAHIFISNFFSLKYAEEADPVIGDLLRQIRQLQALYRLSFRPPSKTELSEEDKALVTEYIEFNFANTRKGVLEGTYPASHLEALVHAKKEWEKLHYHQEL